MSTHISVICHFQDWPLITQPDCTVGSRYLSSDRVTWVAVLIHCLADSLILHPAFKLSKLSIEYAIARLEFC